MRKEVGTLDATPSKRLFLSIIADYNLDLALCELVDNVLDLWTMAGKRHPVQVKIDIDTTQQSITVSDSAGGVSEGNLEQIIAPGQTRWAADDPTIGIFGVGSKRAVVHLAQEVRITTRRRGAPKTFEVEFDDKWLLDSDDWRLPYFEVGKIPSGTTVVSLSRLRNPVSPPDVDALKVHLASTYAEFLSSGLFTILVGDESIIPRVFANWAYPPGLEPKEYSGALTMPEGGVVRVKALIGLMRESSAVGDWGVYLYCNGRLIASALKDPAIGFETHLIGRPHPDISLLRAELHLEGPARAMPWNSQKSGISYDHRVFQSIRTWAIPVLREWASISRKLSGDWGSRVSAFSTGVPVATPVESFAVPGKSHLPEVESARPSPSQRLKQANQKVADKKPWSVGLYEGVAVVRSVLRLNLSHRNRLALILLDGTFEIAMKEYLVNESGHHYSDVELAKLFKHRSDVQTELQKYFHIDAATWRKFDYFYNLRCKLIHERATVEVSDDDIERFGRLVENTLRHMFGLRFKA